MDSKHEVLQTLAGYVLTALEHNEVNQLSIFFMVSVIEHTHFSKITSGLVIQN